MRIFTRKTRYFGSRSNPGTGKHNIKKATVLLTIKLMEDCGYPPAPAYTLAGRTPGVSRDYLDARLGEFESPMKLIARKPALSDTGRLCLVVKLAAEGRRFIQDLEETNPELHANLVEKIIAKNQDLDAFNKHNFRSDSVAELKHTILLQQARQPKQQQPQPKPQPAQPVTPVNHTVEYLHFQNYIVDLSLPNFNYREFDFIPPYCAEARDMNTAKSLFASIKTGSLKLVCIDGQIVQDN